MTESMQTNTQIKTSTKRAKYVITKQTSDWFMALANYGMFTVDAHGRGDLSPTAKEVIRALHEMLAGGDVTLQVKVPGSQGIRQELDQKLGAAMASVNLEDGISPYSP
jgi:hypothetical protein